MVAGRDFQGCECPSWVTDGDWHATQGRWLEVMSVLNERQTRLYAAEKALELGQGGIALLARVSGLSERTIRRGIRELEAGHLDEMTERARHPGGGRKPVEQVDPTLVDDLETLMGETTAGDPMRLLKWTTKSVRSIAEELKRKRHEVSHTTVHRLLRALDYSLWGDRRSLEGKQHPQRDAQFRYLHRQVKRCFRAGIPVISMDTKKKELVGEFHNKGRRWGKQQHLVNTYDFPSLAEGPAYPYGLYDEGHNEGFVNVGMTHDTAEFAVESLDRWWRMLGRRRYPKAMQLLITADGGGSNGSRNRLWKYSLQQFADRHGLTVTVCHYPPGTSKWNNVEHRLFSQISVTWRGEPLVSYETVLNLIGSTTTRTGLKVKAMLDTHEYETGKKVTNEQMSQVRLAPHKTHPKWNYTIHNKGME
jgi:Rhodopirellula transposase DDE domain